MRFVPFALLLAACPDSDDTDAVDTDPGDTGVDDTGVDDTSDTGDTDDTEVVDTTAPEVEMFMPRDTSTAVLPDSVIVVTFSERMDAASVEAAWSCSLGQETSFLWNDEGDVLTVVFDGALPTMDARQDRDAQVVTWAIDTTATDLAGNALNRPVDASFTVARRWAGTLGRADTLTGRASSDGSTSTATMWVGDNGANVRMRSVATFNLRLIPAPVAIESATLTFDATSSVGEPWSNLGDFQILRTTFGTMSAAYAATSEDAPIVVPAFRPGVLDVDVADLVESAFADVDAGDRLQVAFAFSAGSDADDMPDHVVLDLEAGTPTVEVSLLVE